MSVRPVLFNADSSVRVQTEECGHSGTVLPIGIGFHGVDFRTMPLKCPVCSTTSYHPIGGGADAAGIQRLFAQLMMRLGCPCSTPLLPGATKAAANAHLQTHVAQLEGPNRWVGGEP